MALFKANRDELEQFGDAVHEMPAYLDAELTAATRTLAADAGARARAGAGSARPNARTRRHAGAYHWRDLVDSIRVVEDAGKPFLVFGSDDVPGWANWESGSDRQPQFGPRDRTGRFLGPAIEDAQKAAEAAAADIATRVGSEMEG